MRNMQYWGRNHHHLPLVDADGIAIDNKFVTFHADLACVTAVGRIIFKHVDLANGTAALKTARDHFINKQTANKTSVRI